MSDSLGPRPYTFMPGYDTTVGKTRYMNVGYVKSPYPGKEGVGDWGPLQGGGIYYQPYNPTYPYPLNYSPSIPESEHPTLVYDQDIPTFIRKRDMAIHGVSDRRQPPYPTLSKTLANQTSNEKRCDVCYEHTF